MDVCGDTDRTKTRWQLPPVPVPPKAPFVFVCLTPFPSPCSPKALGGPNAAAPATALEAIGLTWAEMQERYPGYIDALLSLRERGEGIGEPPASVSVWTEMEARRGQLLKKRLLEEVGPEPFVEEKQPPSSSPRQQGRGQKQQKLKSSRGRKPPSPPPLRKPPPLQGEDSEGEGGKEEKEADGGAGLGALPLASTAGGWRRVKAPVRAEEVDEADEQEGVEGEGSPPPLSPRGKGFVIAISKGG